MTYAAAVASFAREPFHYVEIETGGTTYRYCTPRELIPVGLDAIPCLKSAPDTSPAEVDATGGPGLRASVSCQMVDFADLTAGGVSYWPKWRAVNKFYEGDRLSSFSGFIEGNLFDPANFTRRDYVIEKFALTMGGASFTGKDPLKLASNNKAQIPAASRGSIVVALTAVATSATLQPLGVGAEYPASGFVRIRSEIMAYTRAGDVLTLTRGRYNTAATTHGAGDSVQLCRVFNDSAPNIVRDILIASGVPSGYIPITEWQAEAAVYLPGNYTTIITAPTGATTLLKELGEQAPHLLYWNDKTNRIDFVAVKAPPEDARGLDWRDHIIAGSFTADDDPSLRVTRVFVYFGQFDPTKKLDEPANYQQTFIRVDPGAETDYGSSATKLVYSRWISTVNKAAAIRLAARIGRRFFNTPRRIGLSVDVKDQDVWTGSAVKVTHPLIVDTAGAPVATDFQIISAAEKPGKITYKAIEFLYGPSVPEDADADTTGKLIVLSGELQNLNLRTVFDSIYPSYDPADDVRFIFDAAAVMGSSSTSTPAIVTGTWAGLTTPPLLDVRGLILGAGGKGAGAGATAAGGNGGDALELQAPIRLSNSGTIGGGGGGGGAANPRGGVAVAGSGGAGYSVGPRGEGGDPPANPGNRLTGGESVEATAIDGEGSPFPVVGGRGGDLGQPGAAGFSDQGTTTAGGSAGLAIKRNGFTITYTGAGAGNTPGGVV